MHLPFIACSVQFLKLDIIASIREVSLIHVSKMNVDEFHTLLS